MTPFHPTSSKVDSQKSACEEGGEHGHRCKRGSATQAAYNPLICRYVREARLSGKELAERCSISHSRIYVARTQCVSSNNAERISHGMAHNPDIPEEERLELKDVEIL